MKFEKLNDFDRNKLKNNCRDSVEFMKYGLLLAIAVSFIFPFMIESNLPESWFDDKYIKNFIGVWIFYSFFITFWFVFFFLLWKLDSFFGQKIIDNCKVLLSLKLRYGPFIIVFVGFPRILSVTNGQHESIKFLDKVNVELALISGLKLKLKIIDKQQLKS